MLKIRIMLVTLVVTFCGAVSATHKSGHSVDERTAPSGKVFHEGDDVPVAVAAVTETSGPRNGESVFTLKCAMCHGTGVGGAPKIGDSAAWAPRIAQGEAMLLEHAINGFQGSTGVMPARGTCADCSDDEIQAAIEHMVAASQ